MAFALIQMNKCRPSGLKFPKTERLHHRSLVEKLFNNGKSFYEYPLRVSWKILSDEELKKNFRNTVPESIGPLQLLITVPKKKRRKAVDRVLMRRRIREAFRINRLSLRDCIEDSPDIATLSVALVYIHTDNLPFSQINEKVKIILNKLQVKLEKLSAENKP